MMLRTLHEITVAWPWSVPRFHRLSSNTARPTRWSPQRSARLPLLLAALLLAALLLARGTCLWGDEAVDYIRDIKPILSDSCYRCHGPDEKTREAELRLDVRDSALAHAFSPGRPEQSELIARVTSSDPDIQMPPPAAKRPRLTSDQIQLLRRWIEQGGNYQKHWSYVPPTRPPVPAVDSGTTKTPIDNFIQARLKRENLPPSPAADPRTLLRRLYFDLVGLPPSPAAVAEFVQDASDDRYEALVNELLERPTFGERLAVSWLDAVRYADSVGIHGDQENSMSPYRDYVVKAFNQSMPFDQFIAEQIAGDLWDDATIDQRIASAFNRLHMITSEGGAQPKEYLAIYAADRVRNTAAALFGTTLGCCQCHDHKFDPFTTKEFYQFASFFADLEEQGVYSGSNWTPKLEVPTDRQLSEVAAVTAQIDEVQGQVTEELPADAPARKQLAELEQRLAGLKQSIPTVLVSRSVAPREMRVLPRGNWLDDSGEVVSPAFPAALTAANESAEPPAADSPRLTRRDLARWLTDRQHPLLARVFVNRIWKLMLGEGIVRTLDDFGSRGDLPSHPQLLDWLAVEFIDSGWDIKHIFRLIANSHTYRQSSLATDELRQRDPANRWLARQNRFRFDAEIVRDNALAVSGLLEDRVGGPSVRPYQPARYYAHLNFPAREYQPSTGADLYRRSVYTHWQRTFLHPSLLAFDAPTREECTVRRTRSNTPLQSLVLLNDPIYVEAARVLAERLLRESPGDDFDARLGFAFQQVLQRTPSADERELLAVLYRKHRAHYGGDRPAASQLLTVGAFPHDPHLDEADLAAWTSICRTLLSLHETITRN